MGLLSKLFGSKQAAPQCEVHASDRLLLRVEDAEWWNGLTLNDWKLLEQEDSAFRLAAWMKFVEQDGLSESDAAKRVRLTFPTYYATIKQREDEKFPLGSEDAKLPYPLKNRVNSALMSGAIDKQSVLRASSFNALVRQLVREGEL